MANVRRTNDQPITIKDPGSDVTATVRDLTNADALNVAVVDADGNQVTSFSGSGGTSMTDDAAFTPATSSVTPIGAFADDTTPDSVDEGDIGAVRMSLRRELYVQIRDAQGNERGLRVDANGAIAVTGSTGGVTHTDDAAFTPATDDVVPAAAMFDDTLPDSVDEGDAGVLRMSANRNLYTTLRDAAGNERGVNVNASNALLVAQTGELPAGTQNIGDVDIASALPAGTNNIGDVDVLSVIPGTGATNLGKAIDSAGGATDTGIAPLAIRDDALAALTPVEGDYVALRVDANGALWVHDDALDAALAGSELQVDIVSIAAGDNNIGNVDVLSVIPGSGATNLGKAEDAAHASGDVGVMALAVRDDTLGIASGTEGDYEPLHTDDEGALWATLKPTIRGGLSIFKSIDLDETEEAVKATAGQIYGLHVMNMTAAPLFFKIYNATVATVVVGTTVPDITIPIPGNNDSDGGGFTWTIPQGVAFGTAITVACTTGVADADAGAPAANACVVTVLYK